MFRGYLAVLPLDTLEGFVNSFLPCEFGPIIAYLKDPGEYGMTLTLEDGSAYYIMKTRNSSRVIIGVEREENRPFSPRDLEQKDAVAARYNCIAFVKVRQDQSMHGQIHDTLYRHG